MPQVSIIVPVYNVEKYLHRCIKSILTQTFTDFELILIDDGSPDNSGVLCDEYAKKDNRIVVFHQKNGGAAAARNVGIDWVVSHSESQWITFVDADDWIHPNMLEMMFSALKYSDDALMSICDRVKVDSYSELFDKVEFKCECYDSLEFYAQFSQLVNVPWCKLFHKSLFTNHRFLVGKLYEDVFLIYKLLYEAKKIVYIDSILYFYYQNEDSVMHSKYHLRKLDEVEAGEEQLAFFKKINDDKNIRAALKRLMYYYTYHTEQLYKLPEGKKYARKLKHKLIKLLIFKSKYCGVSISENMWYYETAFPLFMKCYFRFKKLISLIKRN
ncbi:MAG: glycosyltransferase family 2 protein [Acutalibacteraceae bacterium]|nr:glycosyltransferase family 2 protein [Acutalibacteraceae bacterium]